MQDEEIAQLYLKIKSNTNIKFLKFIRNKITDDGASIIFRALCFNKSITSLYLNNNLVSDKSLPLLLKVAQCNKRLKNVYLTQCKINKREARSIQAELKSLGLNLII